MTKQDVIRQIVARTGSDPLTTGFVLASFFEVVKLALTENEPIYVRKFGSFILKQRAGKIARNIGRNTAIELAAYTVPYFKPSAEFADQVKAQAIPDTPKKQPRNVRK